VQLLRGYKKKHPKIWDEQLVYIKHSYSKVVHSLTKKSNFKACYGYFPPSPSDVVYGKQEEDVVYGQQEEDDQEVHEEENRVGRSIDRIR
jgi:hypothetical protein